MSDCVTHQLGQHNRGVSGVHDDRLSGLRDLLHYAKGASLLDIGMNHGLISFEFARSGAILVHGCDIYEPGVLAAREIFTEIGAKSRFEIVDLAAGPEALERAFGQDEMYRTCRTNLFAPSRYHSISRYLSQTQRADVG